MYYELVNLSAAAALVLVACQCAGEFASARARGLARRVRMSKSARERRAEERSRGQPPTDPVASGPAVPRASRTWYEVKQLAASATLLLVVFQAAGERARERLREMARQLRCADEARQRPRRARVRPKAESAQTLIADLARGRTRRSGGGRGTKLTEQSDPPQRTDAASQTDNPPEEPRARDAEVATQCVVCLSCERQSVFSCGHVCACARCAAKLEACPLCRRKLTGYRRVFLS
jgi:hypothetical protein